MIEKIKAELMAKMSEEDKADFDDSLKVTQEIVVKLLDNIGDCVDNLEQRRCRKEEILANISTNSVVTHTDVMQLNSSFEEEQKAYTEYLFAITALSNYIVELNSKKASVRELRKIVSPKSPNPTWAEQLRAVIEKPREDFTSEDIVTIISARWYICSQLTSFDEKEVATWLLYIETHMLENPLAEPDTV